MNWKPRWKDTLLFLAVAARLGAQPVLDAIAVLGGNGSDVVTGMVLDARGNSYLSGYVLVQPEMEKVVNSVSE
jgi:hypothetical protein